MSYIEFDGSNDYITFPMFFDPAGGEFTLLFAFRSDVESPGFPPHVIMSGQAALNQKPWFVHNLGHDSYSELTTATLSGPTIVPGEWYLGMLHRTLSPDRFTIGIRSTARGDQRQSQSNPTMQSFSGEGTVYLGRNAADGFEFFWPGATAWMAHWSRGLTDPELTQMFGFARDWLATGGISL